MEATLQRTVSRLKPLLRSTVKPRGLLFKAQVWLSGCFWSLTGVSAMASLGSGAARHRRAPLRSYGTLTSSPKTGQWPNRSADGRYQTRLVLSHCTVFLPCSIPDLPRGVDVHGGNGQPHNDVWPDRGPEIGRH